MTVLPLYIGILNAEGDEHKNQVRFLFQHLFANYCLNTTSSAGFWLVLFGYWDVKCLTTR